MHHNILHPYCFINIELYVRGPLGGLPIEPVPDPLHTLAQQSMQISSDSVGHLDLMLTKKQKKKNHYSKNENA